jgi:hypothetical protein
MKTMMRIKTTVPPPINMVSASFDCGFSCRSGSPALESMYDRTTESRMVRPSPSQFARRNYRESSWTELVLPDASTT